MACKEFTLINRYFNRKKIPCFNVEIGIGDDCALLNIPKKQTLAVSTDTLVCGRHFLPNINSADLAYKAIIVGISNLSAMGAKPAWLTLALTLPKIDEIWLKKFSNMLFEQLNYYNMHLIGGDTTAGPLSITLTTYGFVPIGKALKRSGAKPGDKIYVTGTLGDSSAGLAILQNKLILGNDNDAEYLINRHLRPTPHIMYAQKLRKYASSAIDLSDGLICNLKHILRASKVGALINLNTFPLSKAMRKHVKPKQALRWALSGGEDYELLFTIPDSYHKISNLILSYPGIISTCIGQILPKSKNICFIKNGKKITPRWEGYDHFSQQSYYQK